MRVGPQDVGVEDPIPIRWPSRTWRGARLCLYPQPLKEGGVIDELELGTFVELDAVV
jgi:hypothetical protein